MSSDYEVTYTLDEVRTAASLAWQEALAQVGTTPQGFVRRVEGHLRPRYQVVQVGDLIYIMDHRAEDPDKPIGYMNSPADAELACRSLNERDKGGGR